MDHRQGCWGTYGIYPIYAQLITHGCEVRQSIIDRIGSTGPFSTPCKQSHEAKAFRGYKRAEIIFPIIYFLLIPLHRRAFPKWFGEDLDSSDLEYYKECRRSRLDYQHFVYEWGYLLERSSCPSADQGCGPVEHFWGEVDRCLTGLLGPTHFMNQTKERYPSFMLTKGPFEYHNSKQFVIAEAVSTSSFQYMVISSPSQ